jgi:hypothetical protein
MAARTRQSSGKNRWEMVRCRSRVAAPSLTRIGVLTKDPGARVWLRGGTRETLPRGFEHF